MAVELGKEGIAVGKQGCIAGAGVLQRAGVEHQAKTVVDIIATGEVLHLLQDFGREFDTNAGFGFYGGALEDAGGQIATLNRFTTSVERGKLI